MKKFLSTLSFIPASFAASTADVTLENPIGAGSIPDLISKIFTGLSNILYVIVPIMIVVGAFQMLFSTGDPEKFKKGQHTIVYAVIGLVVLLMAQGIVAIVRSILTV